MGVLDRLFGHKQNKLVALTELGRHKAEEVVGSQGLRLKVVNYLEEHDASSVSEIASGISVPTEQVKAIVNKLYREQWVTLVKGSGGD